MLEVYSKQQSDAQATIVGQKIKAVRDSQPLATTYETIALTGTGQSSQVIQIRDADKVVGFTLASQQAGLDTLSGNMTGTWLIGDNRDITRCELQVLEYPYIKFISCSCTINNDAGTFTISNKSARYWDITAALPQSNMNTGLSEYELGKLILVRAE